MTIIIPFLILLTAVIIFYLTIRIKNKPNDLYSIFDGLKCKETKTEYILNTNFNGFPKKSLQIFVDKEYIHVAGRVLKDFKANSFDKSWRIPKNANINLRKIKIKNNKIIINIPKQPAE